MSKINTQVMSGFMELLPAEQILFNKMYDSIRKTYELFGFIPLDTPVIERAEVLFAKAGIETEKQIYQIDNRQALRFDLTVPLARYVADHMNELTFPFRRYQMGKVYRGERAQRGRYREFYQCDIDIVSNTKPDLMNDAELVSVIETVFNNLNIGKFTIRINNRKILNGFFDSLSIFSKTSEILKIIDKLEKIGQNKVKAELFKINISEKITDKILSLISLNGSPDKIIKELKNYNTNNQTFLSGVQELEQIEQNLQQFGVEKENYVFDLSIARGLDYYTGTVYETALTDLPEIGSICSGGRYDNLSEVFSNSPLPGVGLSIGLTRLFSQLLEYKIIDPTEKTTSKVLILPLADNLLGATIDIAKELRNAGVNTQVYLEKAKIKKKLDYANRLNISHVILVGEDEIKTGKLTIKNMGSGQQDCVDRKDLIKIINK